MALPRLALIGVPSSAGGRRTGQERAPAAFRAAGLVERLVAEGLDLADLGDLPVVSFRPDLEHPRRQNLDLVLSVARQVADCVDRALADHRRPLVLGGDCSLSLGVIAGMLRHVPRLGLLYFDADLDLNTPDSSVSGILDGMVLAHALGRGVPRLAEIGPRFPLLSDEEIVLFGYDSESGWIDPPELEALERSRMSRYSLADVRSNPVGTATDALLELQRRSEVILIHFDVDVTNCPAVDVPHPGGLDVESALEALKVFTAAPTCSAVVVTELNAELDADGTQAARFVEGLVGALAACRTS